jgi:hypothetical protein
MTDCIKLNGKKQNGYSRLKVDGKMVRAHRYFWESHYFPIPPGKVLHHTCGNKDCVNIQHLQLMTKAEHDELHSKLDWNYVKFARMLRNKYGFSIAQLAKHGEIPYSTMYDIIKNRTWKPA